MKEDCYVYAYKRGSRLDDGSAFQSSIFLLLSSISLVGKDIED
jgi:hypothetical protein